MSIRIACPVDPYRGIRDMDPWGSGVFGASRDGGARQHSGLDFLALPGDDVCAPITGTVVSIGKAYPDGDLYSIHIHGDGDYRNWRIKMLYAAPAPGLYGKYVSAGDSIGTAQNVAEYWKAKSPSHTGEMKNHVHVEVWITEPRAVDPARLLPEGLVAVPGEYGLTV